ncbi:hypothetical protein HK100_009554 [Physocladia obscura]|uniref:L-type lectin-like domain-containing protein n=1 Tax=Physocladia obscura TaxID=109957 RepID=A0AAD5T366_9FUNG|nr:hypothetical protein HK100_009554 [Physocladia obscura]
MASALSSHSFTWPFLDVPFGNSNFDYGGDAIINLKDRRIVLTPDEPHHSGWIWSKQQLVSTAWTSTFEFAISGKHGLFHGDGFAFWFTRNRGAVSTPSGPVFGNIDNYVGLAVIFDTFKNSKQLVSHKFPYVSVSIGDGIKGYHFESDNIENELGGCSIDGLLRNANLRTLARVEYVKEEYLRVLKHNNLQAVEESTNFDLFYSTSKVSLNLNGDDKSSWKECTLIKNASLPTFGYMGFTARTGAASDHHEIISLETNGISNVIIYKNFELQA